MKKIISGLLALFFLTGCVLSFSGCGGEEEPTANATQEAEAPKFDYANATADDLLAEIKDQAKLTDEEKAIATNKGWTLA